MKELFTQGHVYVYCAAHALSLVFTHACDTPMAHHDLRFPMDRAEDRSDERHHQEVLPSSFALPAGKLSKEWVKASLCGGDAAATESCTDSPEHHKKVPAATFRKMRKRARKMTRRVREVGKPDFPRVFCFGRGEKGPRYPGLATDVWASTGHAT